VFLGCIAAGRHIERQDNIQCCTVCCRIQVRSQQCTSALLADCSLLCGELDKTAQRLNHHTSVALSLNIMSRCRQQLQHVQQQVHVGSAALWSARRKVLPFPVFGGITKPVLAAEWPVGGADNWRDSWRRPRLQLGLSVDDAPSSNDDGATLTSNGSLAFRRKVFVTRRWGVEVRTREAELFRS
jgi:hypothetical protein